MDKSCQCGSTWVLLISLVVTVQGEFRFCHFGPQKFQNKDCPYGLFIPRPIRSSCVYYANDQSGPAGEAELESCRKAPVTLSTAGERMNDVSLQAVFVNVQEPNENGEAGNLEAKDCEEECLKQYREFSSSQDSGIGSLNDPEEPDYDYMLDTLPEDAKNAQKKLTTELFLELLEDNSTAQLSYLRTAKLLEQSMRIVTTQCTPYVTPEFMEQIYKGFLFLLLRSKDSIQDIGILEYTAIELALRQCESKLKPKIEGLICDDYSKIIRFRDETLAIHNYTIKAKSFRWDKYDPFVEAAWSVVDFVHGFCPPFHAPNFNFHHVYELAMEVMFTKSIIQRWTNPTPLKRDYGYWNNLLNVKDAQLMMRNLDGCIQAGYVNSIYSERLNRPFSKFPVLMGRASRNTNSEGKQTGWQKGIAAYWEEYKQSDGFNKFLDKVGGVCIKTEDALNSMRAQMTENVCKP